MRTYRKASMKKSERKNEAEGIMCGIKGGGI
jgi:hypothetical protein